MIAAVVTISYTITGAYVAGVAMADDSIYGPGEEVSEASIVLFALIWPLGLAALCCRLAFRRGFEQRLSWESRRALPAARVEL